jgi:hypothetical protein
MKQDLNVSNLLPALKENARHVLRYAGIMFFCLVAGIYIFVLFRINTLASAQPTAEETASTTKLQVNRKIADQLLKLEDNSVNVQSLFDDARNNPFQE